MNFEVKSRFYQFERKRLLLQVPEINDGFSENFSVFLFFKSLFYDAIFNCKSVMSCRDFVYFLLRIANLAIAKAWR